MIKTKMPSAYTILFSIIIIMAILTWVIPAGQYEYLTDGGPVAGTYHSVEPNGQTVTDVFLAAFNGLYGAIDVAAFILMVGGYLGVMVKTGAISAAITGITGRLRGREKLMIPILMCVFALGGTTFGMAEETIAFYPLVLPIVIAAGYDAVTAVSVIMLGAGAGVLGSTVNPFATGIASGFAGISLGEGIILRLGILLASLAVTIWYVMRYAEKTKANPGLSLVADMAEKHREHFLTLQGEEVKLTGKRKTSLVIFALTFIIMIYSVIPFEDIGITFLPTLGWWFPELSALFFVSAVAAGLVYRLNQYEIIDGFLEGAKDLLGVAFIIGISRGITVIMNSGHITDTILSWGESLLTGTGSVVFTLLSYAVFLPLSFLIPSTSGLATLSMPIMAPLSDFSGMGRDIVITAFQSACGLVNLITPTSAVVMGGLAIGKIPYDRWLKFVWKLLIILFAISAAFLILGSLL
ncbi:MAG: YfcC family protein [Bacillota bacterium]|nr:YfcC family protein [Bacillota bacterium]